MRFRIWHLLLITLLIAFALAATMKRKSKWERMSPSSAITRLLSALQSKHPEWELPANLTGMSQERIAKLRKEMPDAPDQLFELYAVYDFECVTLFPPVDTLKPESLQSMIQGQIDFYEQHNGGWVGWTSSTHDACKIDQSWREKWIPIGSFNGDNFFIDMDPSNNGIAGQIVISNDDGKYLTVEGYSLAHWIDRIAANVEAGETDPGDYSVFVYSDLEPVDAD